MDNRSIEGKEFNIINNNFETKDCDFIIIDFLPSKELMKRLLENGYDIKVHTVTIIRNPEFKSKELLVFLVKADANVLDITFSNKISILDIDIYSEKMILRKSIDVEDIRLSDLYSILI